MFPATRPNLPSAVASEDKEKNRQIVLPMFFFGFCEVLVAETGDLKHCPHKAEKGRRS
jgi:hypothetical protein